MFTFPEFLHETFIALAVSLIMAAGVAIWARVKDKLPWSTMAVYGLVVFCCVLFIFNRLWPPSWKEKVTDDNIELKIRQWLDAFNVNSGRVNDDSTIFNYAATKEGTPPITIAREKEHPSYITVGTKLGLGKEDQGVYDKLSDQEKTELRMLLGAELSKTRIGMVPDPSSGLWPITIITRIPISPNLYEADFYRGIDQVDFGFILANNTIEIFLGRFRQLSPTLNMEASPH